MTAVTRFWWPILARHGLSTETGARPTSSTRRSWLDLHGLTLNSYIPSTIAARSPRLIWPSSAPGTRWSALAHAVDQPRPGDGQVLRGSSAEVLRRELPQKGRRCAALRTCRSPRRCGGDHRLAHRDDQGLREAHRASLQRKLSAGDRAAAAGCGSRGAYLPDLCPDPGGSRSLQEKPDGGSIS